MSIIPIVVAAAALLALSATLAVLIVRRQHAGRRARADAALRAATARLVHHIRNPVQSILLHADLLGTGAIPSDGPSAEAGRAIITEAERLAGMLRELSAYAGGAGAAPTCGHTPAHALLVELARRAPAGAPTVSVEGDATVHVAVAVDELRQALSPLLANAIDAVAGRPDGRVDARISVHGRRAAIVITDNGDGIPPDRLSRVFEPFVSWKPGAMGLGLARAREVIERHGGRIGIESALGAGTAVRVLLPRAAPTRRPRSSRPSMEVTPD